jgi:hypothetical protein
MTAQYGTVAVEINKPLSVALLVAIVVGVLAAATAGFFLRKHVQRKYDRERLYRTIKLVAHQEPGTPQVEAAGSATPQAAVQIKAVRGEPGITVSLAEQEPGEATHA